MTCLSTRQTVACARYSRPDLKPSMTFVVRTTDVLTCRSDARGSCRRTAPADTLPVRLGSRASGGCSRTGPPWCGRMLVAQALLSIGLCANRESPRWRCSRSPHTMANGITTRPPVLSVPLAALPTSMTLPIDPGPLVSPTASRDEIVEQVKVRAADRATGHLDDRAATMLDCRIGHCVATDILLAVSDQRFHVRLLGWASRAGCGLARHAGDS